MQLSIPRLLPVSATVALLLSACGSSEPPSSGQPVDAPDDAPEDVVDGLRAPTPIRTEGGAAVAVTGAAEAGVAADAMIAPHWIITEFLAGELGALPGNTTGYVFDGGSMPIADDAARIAAALGVDGSPELIDDGFSVHYRVGPDDGSAASVVVWDDAMLSWNYSAPWDEGVARGCAVAGSTGVAEPVDAEVSDPLPLAEPTPDEEPPEEPVIEPVIEPVVEPVECIEPEPPTGVPTAAEAEARVTEMLAAFGVDTGTVSFETYADEWWASVTVHEKIGGVVARSWGFSFAGEAELQYAWGGVAEPVPVGPYDLIDLPTAIERLNDGRYGWGSPVGGVAVMEADSAVSSAIEPAAAPPEGDAPPPEPEEITVTLVDVAPDLWWIWDVDGSAWLVPAYRFTGDDGGTYTVPAISDEFLIEVEPPAVEGDDPIPVEPDGGIGDGAGPVPGGLPEPGLTLDDYTAEAEDLGFVVRVVEIDGEPLAATADFVANRINVAVETRDGVEVVVRATLEGDVLTVVPVESVRKGVEYYPACGNETLEVDGTTWYPVGDRADEGIAALYEAIVSVDREPFPLTGGFAKVVDPGPGDDIGTLVIWADGFARWVSDSGDLDVWLTQTAIDYLWVC